MTSSPHQLDGAEKQESHGAWDSWQRGSRKEVNCLIRNQEDSESLTDAIPGVGRTSVASSSWQGHQGETWESWQRGSRTEVKLRNEEKSLTDAAAAAGVGSESVASRSWSWQGHQGEDQQWQQGSWSWQGHQGEDQPEGSWTKTLSCSSDDRNLNNRPRKTR